jgi:hypothetical protein
MTRSELIYGVNKCILGWGCLKCLECHLISLSLNFDNTCDIVLATESCTFEVFFTDSILSHSRDFSLADQTGSGNTKQKHTCGGYYPISTNKW